VLPSTVPALWHKRPVYTSAKHTDLKSRKPVVWMVGAGTDRTMSGAHLRRARLFNVASGRALITAFDHGIALGPMPGSEAAFGALKCIVGVGPDGILIFPGMMNPGQRVSATVAMSGKPTSGANVPPVERRYSWCSRPVYLEALQPLQPRAEMRTSLTEGAWLWE
jgi:hypothetical protein